MVQLNLSVSGPATSSAVLDVTSFGAVGDGVTDDTAAIQRAEAAAALQGKRLVFAPGTYAISYALQMSNNSDWVAAPGTATLVATANTPLVTAVWVQHATIDGLSFEGMAQPSGSASPLLIAYKSQGVLLVHDTFQNTAGIGALFSDVNGSSVVNSTFTNIGNSPADLSKSAQAVAFTNDTTGFGSNNSVTGSVFTKIGLDAISATSQVGFHALSNVMKDLRTNDGWIDLDAAPAGIYGNGDLGLIVAGNVVQDASGNGIDIANSSQVSVYNNRLARSGSAGIALTSVAGAAIAGNVATDNNQLDHFLFKGGIVIGDQPGGAPSSDITIAANVLSNTDARATQAFGIQVYETAHPSDVSITRDNVFIGNAVSAVSAPSGTFTWTAANAISFPISSMNSINRPQKIWLTIPKGIASLPDINNLFSDDSQWSDVSSSLTMFKFYSSEVSQLGTSSFIQLLQNVSKLNGTGVPLMTELGVLPSTGTDGIGYGIEGFFGTFINIFKAISWADYVATTRLHVTLPSLKYVAMDEPLYYGHDSKRTYVDPKGVLGYAPQWSIDEVASHVAAALVSARVYDPTVRFGDIEPIPAVNADEVKTWIAAYRAATGENLAFFQADVIWGAPHWQRTLESISSILAEDNIPLNIIINGNGGAASPTQWTDQALVNLISIFLDPQIHYDSINIQNWSPNGPSSLLGPDLTDTTNGTLTVAAHFTTVIGPVESEFETAYNRSANPYELYYAVKSVGTNVMPLSVLSTTLLSLEPLETTLSLYSDLNSPLPNAEDLVSSASSGQIIQDPEPSNAASIALLLGFTLAQHSWFLVPDISSPSVDLTDIGNPKQIGYLYISGSAGLIALRDILLPSSVVAVINILPLTSGQKGTAIFLGSSTPDFVYLSSGAATYVVGNAYEHVVDATGTNVSVVEATASNAWATVIGASDTRATLRITTAGTATLNNADNHLTVLLTGGANRLALGHGSDITVFGTSGVDSFTVGAPTQSIIAGTGDETVFAAAFLAGVKIIGSSQARTKLNVTVPGRVVLNNADSNLTVQLSAGTNHLTLGTMGFITAIGGTSGAETIIAGAANQTLISQGGTDTMVGFVGGGDVFKGTCANLSKDVIWNFTGSDVIDLTDLTGVNTSIRYDIPTSRLTINDGIQSTSIVVRGGYKTANFYATSDESGGTAVHFQWSAGGSHSGLSATS